MRHALRLLLSCCDLRILHGYARYSCTYGYYYLSTNHSLIHCISTWHLSSRCAYRTRYISMSLYINMHICYMRVCSRRTNCWHRMISHDEPDFPSREPNSTLFPLSCIPTLREASCACGRRALGASAH